MPSYRIWRSIWVALLVLILMTLTLHYSTREETKWKRASAKGLHLKMQTGLTQLYWQWQKQGRDNKIDYQPENANNDFVINMNSQGLPVIEENIKGCTEFLNWFVDEKTLNIHIKVTTTLSSKKEFLCKFDYAMQIYQYNPKTGVLTFS